MRLRFLRASLPYAPGEVADFPEPQAEKLLHSGAAVAEGDESGSAPPHAPAAERIIPTGGHKARLKRVSLDPVIAAEGRA